MASFIQCRKLQMQNVQPVIQIQPEFTLPHILIQIPVRCGHNAYIDKDHFIITNSHHLSLLNHTQKFRLQLQRNLSNFVQKYCSGMCLFKQTFFTAFLCTGKGAVHISE